MSCRVSRPAYQGILDRISDRISGGISDLISWGISGRTSGRVSDPTSVGISDPVSRGVSDQASGRASDRMSGPVSGPVSEGMPGGIYPRTRAHRSGGQVPHGPGDSAATVPGTVCDGFRGVGRVSGEGGRIVKPVVTRTANVPVRLATVTRAKNDGHSSAQWKSRRADAVTHPQPTPTLRGGSRRPCAISTALLSACSQHSADHDAHASPALTVSPRRLSSV